MKTFFFAIAVLALTLHPSAEADKYEVYAVRFATIANFPVASLVADARRKSAAAAIR